jgi:arginine-tRNA-protein transferase
MPYCEGCQACVSVRVLVNEFEPSRSFRRVLDLNRDMVARRIQATPTSEQYSLFRDYIDARHADGGMADMTVLDYAMMVEDSIIDTFVTEYRLKPDLGANHEADKRPLLGVALCDRLSDGISMVYSFYEPEAARRGLGTYMILEHIAYARRLGIPYLYLGYWIHGSPKMSYKKRFQPQEHLTGNGWVRS